MGWLHALPKSTLIFLAVLCFGWVLFFTGVSDHARAREEDYYDD